MDRDLGDISARLFELKNKKTQLNNELSVLNAEIKETEIIVLALMQEQDLLKVSNSSGTIYLSRQVVPKVINWDEFYKYIRDNNYFHMLERRPSRGAFKESYELGEQIPGVDPVLFDEVRTRKT